MRIVLIAYRHWQAGRRFRSLALNGKRLGHQMYGFSGIKHGDDPLTLAAFEELGIEAYHGNRFEELIGGLNPDVIFGERPHPHWEVEKRAQDWIYKHNKIGFLLLHTVITPTMMGYNPGPRTHLLVTNEEQRRRRTPPIDPRWPEDEVHVLGAPGLDEIVAKRDVNTIRARLGVKPGQQLIGLFPDVFTLHRPPQRDLMAILDEAKRRDWKVVIHPHPVTRRLQNDKKNLGFHNRKYLRENLLELQEAGAMMIQNYAPGTISGVRFYRCHSFDLQTAADCLLTISHDVVWEAYACRKRCHLFQDIETRPKWDFIHRWLSGGVDFEFEKSFKSNVEKILSVLVRKDEWIEHDPSLVKERFYKLDGLWWQRALNLAQRLTKS